MRVGIIGAGIGGLATAVGLQRAGVETHVFEQASRLQPIGSGLSIFGNGRTALRSIGLGDGFDRIAAASAAKLTAGQRRPDGAWLSVTPARAVAPLRIVHRADLHDLLVGAVDPSTLHLGSAVEAIGTDGAVASADLVAERFDVVVAADGIRSRTRAALWPDDPGVRYSGYSTWRGVTDVPVALDAAGETWGDGLRFGLAPLVDGRVYWFAVATMPEGAPAAGEKERVQELFGRWHAPIADLIAATDAAAIVRHPISDLAGPLRTFVRDRTALLGDAAHAMTPDLGQGANQALEDAATLSALLAASARGDGDLQGALTSYDALRRPRTQQIAKRARMVGRLAQSSGRVRTALRDAVTRATPPSTFEKQLDGIQSWRAPAGLN
ncbi:2-polyprenyl-6-methoxyphenol hydroxylase-like FAD-dependent oxidoreductase [Diaminobutyricimonas aerilata]|uniref:2-polyprenyl-6-methoxyphenol hydroxylase-like FAD-dependent oxidoreductase n=1 Tax=Diaminobutyricimonas aerilata TaxID=1162967 RepID=A0A2M9CM32_9MICO|nr:FAD-dependent monooxygenase [Diaminobutyricimonas aerilata]PJJ72967.1 2-polyprenyl-6-methoxyphenol hydroxylase-like FAD-dependent oxidoreductase [Diaminobutyricimonas aerilata]